MSDERQSRTEEMVLLGQAGIPRSEIDRQIENICSSKALDGQGKTRDLLRLLVEEALAGRVPRPTEIAEKLGKLDYEDGDPYVRTTTGRLRESLKEYYQTCARRGEIRIEVPKGQYFVLGSKARKDRRPPLADGAIQFKVSIEDPKDLVEVNHRVIVKGRIDSLDFDVRVWLVVRTPIGDLYPQCQVSRKTSEWEHEVRIGLLQWGRDEGAEYEIYLVATRADGDVAFYQYLKSGKDGFGPLLPTDAVVLDAKRVIRRDIRSSEENRPHRS